MVGTVDWRIISLATWGMDSAVGYWGMDSAVGYWGIDSVVGC